jgi:hypothetical protein
LKTILILLNQTLFTNPESLYEQCVDYVNQDFFKFIQLIELIPSESICQAILQCSTVKPPASVASMSDLLNPRRPQLTAEPIQQIIVKPKQVAASALGISVKCDVCDDIVKWTFKFLQRNQTERAISQALESVCSLVYKHSELKQAHCDHLIDQYTVQLINMIVQDFQPEVICHLLTFCPSSSRMQLSLTASPRPTTGLATVRPPTAGPLCFVCVQLFRYVYKHVNANDTEQKIEQVMDHSCDLIFGKVTHNDKRLEQCKTLVTSNSELLVNLIKSNAGPVLTCMATGACVGPSDERLQITLIDSTPNPSPIHMNLDSNCAMCRQVSKRMYRQMKSADSTQQSMIRLSHACDRERDVQQRSDCMLYVFKQEKTLRQAFVQSSSAEQVCTLAHNCPAAASTPASAPVAKPTIAKPLHPASAEGCQLCKMFVGIIYKDLKMNSTQAKIITILDSMCDRYVPTQKRTQCHDYVQAYTTELITILESTSNPTEACTLLGYCGKQTSIPISFVPVERHTKPSTSLTPPTTSDSAPAPVCQQCLQIVTPIHKWITSQKCENQLLQDVAEVCSVCPVKEKCTSLLQGYVKTYFDSVDKFSEPNLVCQSLGLCSASRTVSKINNKLVLKRKSLPFDDESLNSLASVRSHQEQKAPAIPSDWRKELCYECQLVTNYAQTLLFNASFEQALISDAEQVVCKPMTSKMERKICDDFLQKNGPKMIQHFAQAVFNSTFVCEQQLHLCSAPNNSAKSDLFPLVEPEASHHQPKRLVGDSKCTYGPSYWCHSEENASACRVSGLLFSFANLC